MLYSFGGWNSIRHVLTLSFLKERGTRSSVTVHNFVRLTFRGLIAIFCWYCCPGKVRIRWSIISVIFKFFGPFFSAVFITYRNGWKQLPRTERTDTQISNAWFLPCFYLRCTGLFWDIIILISSISCTIISRHELNFFLSTAIQK